MKSALPKWFVYISCGTESIYSICLSFNWQTE